MKRTKTLTVVLVAAGAIVACGGDAMNTIGDAAVDLGEAMRDGGAQDGGGACDCPSPMIEVVELDCEGDEVPTGGSIYTASYSGTGTPIAATLYQPFQAPDDMSTGESCHGRGVGLSFDVAEASGW